MRGFARSSMDHYAEPIVVTTALQSTDVTTAQTQDVSSVGDNKVQITEFVDAETGNQEIYELVDDDTYTEIYKADAALSEFLSRPVLIGTDSWSVGNFLIADYNPWELYFSNPAILRKLDNFAFLRCKLHIKITLNASPFYYGLLGAFYEPLPILNVAPIITSASNADFVPLSQQPHVWCYPGSSQGGEIVCPFIAAENWLRCSDITELQQFGSLHIESYTQLLNANSVPGGSCTVQIYAWAEQVEVCGPTLSLALQSSNQKKKAPGGPSGRNVTTSLKTAMSQHKSYEGTVSGPASAVARATKTASKIAGYAGMSEASTTLAAVSTAATCVSSLASSFGCTDVPVTSKVMPFKDVPFHAFSSADISQPIDKLTLDPQQSVVMSGSAIGAPDSDELDIEAFCRRESYVDTFTWTAANVVDDLIFVSRVTPQIMRVEAVVPGINELIYKTPMAIASDLFRFWRGDIVYRIRIIASQYHRGRLRITWDPQEDLSGISNSYSTNYTRIVDLEEESDVILRIPYAQPASYCTLDDTVIGIRTEAMSDGLGATNIFTPRLSRENGQLSVRVFTEQTSPVSTADIKLIISVWGENMEFSVPDEISSQYSNYALQSRDIIAFDETKGSVPLFQDTIPSGDINLIYFGETITNFKQLMRRVCRSSYQYVNADGTSRFLYIRSHMSRMPLFSGFDPFGKDNAVDDIGVGNSPYNYVYNIPMNWIGMCFLTHRGSINWQFNVLNQSHVSDITIKRENTPLSLVEYNEVFAVANGIDNNFTMSETIGERQSGATGMSLINQITQSGMAANCPMFNSRRFYGTSPNHRTLGSAYDNSNTDGIEVSTEFSPAGGMNAKYVRLDSFCSIGPDFCYHFFLNVPTLQWSPVRPVGVNP